jgi:two-component system, cell cycle sensor histidine kinase and response regulator CckA
MIEKTGFQTVCAGNGREALEIFTQNPGMYDAVILDFAMPELDGERCYHKLREIRPDIPVIISSGFHPNEIQIRFNGVEVAGFLQKPWDLAACLCRATQI